MNPSINIHNNIFSNQQVYLSSFDASLHQWCEEKRGTDEYEHRITAMQRMQECRDQCMPTLNLESLNLTSLPEAINNLSHITELCLAENSLTTLPSLENLQQLTSLDLSFNQFQSLPPQIGNLRQLTSLNLSFNQFQSLPPEIGNLRQLTSLELEHNQLQSLPPEIGNIRQLTGLDLSFNRLQSLPPEIGNLRQLTKLNLSRNQLQSLPQQIENLQNLTNLILSYNTLTAVPSQIAPLRNLTSFVISNNPISLFPSQIGHLHQSSYDPFNYQSHRQASSANLPPFRISKQQFDNHPEQILKQLADWPHLPQKIEFLDEEGTPLPGADIGGIRKQFYTLLIENLLKTPLFSQYLPNGFPTCAEGAEEHNLYDLLVNTARVLSHMYNNNILTGRFFSDDLFALLHIVHTTENPEERTAKIAELLQQPHLHAIAAWLAGDDSYQDEVRAAIEATWDKDEPLKDADLRREAEVLLDNTIEPYVLIAKALLAGCSGQLAQDIQNIAPQEVSLSLQGSPLEAEKLIAAIQIAPPADTNPEVIQKVEWLKERIQQEADQGNTEWLERFLFCITSQKTLSNSARIEVAISANEYCKASTCFNQLQISAAPSTREEFFEKLDLLMADTGFSMA